jgi:hypothetical protein
MTPFQRSVGDAIKRRMANGILSATDAEIAAELGATEAEVNEALATPMLDAMQRWLAETDRMRALEDADE